MMMPEAKMHPLRRYRRLRNITLETLAERASCSPAHLSAIEKSASVPSLPLVKRLVDETGLAWEDFLPVPAEAVE